jgi:hypothetical protein
MFTDQMPLEDYLLPGEEIHFRSGGAIRYGGKKYTAVVTDRRLLLYAKRGSLTYRDDVVMFKIDDLDSVHYKEEGVLPRLGVIEVQGKTQIQLKGMASQTKAIYQQLMLFL